MLFKQLSARNQPQRMQLYQQHQVRESAKIYFASSGKVSFCIENARAATAL